MGKSRRWNRHPRPNPTGLQDLKDFTQHAAQSGSSSIECSRNATLALAMSKLQSPVSEDRECGSEALAMVACNKEDIEDLLKLNVVRIAAPLLLDKSRTVRHSIAGSFRNITAVGGPTVCEHFVQKDVLTPIVHLYQRFYQKWRPAKPKEGAIDSSTEIFIEITSLLWNLCESCEEAVSIFNRHNLLAIFEPCLNVSVYGPRVAVVTAQCLQAVTENNAELLSRLPQGQFKGIVTGMMSLDGSMPYDHHLRTLAAGILLNLHGGKLGSCTTDESLKVLQVLSTTLSVSVTEAVGTFKEQNDELKSSDSAEEQAKKDDQEKEAKDILMTTLSAKEVALEVLTNICCDDEGADEWESLCSSEAGDDMEVPMEEDTQNEASAMTLPVDVKAVLVKLKLVSQVEGHAFMAEDVVAGIPDTKENSDIQELLETLQCSALLCLHNMVAGGVELGEAPSNGHLHQLWIKVAQMVLATAAKSQGNLLEAMSGCLRAIIQRLADERNLSSVVHLTLDDLSALYKVAKDCGDAKVRVNILRAVATIGVLLQQELSAKSEPLISSVGQFLLGVGLEDDDVWVNAEAADAVMEVFAEDHLEALAQQLSLVEKCKSIQGSLKIKAKHRQKQLGENLPVVAMAKTNLSRFIKYKTKLQSNVQG